MLPRQLLQIFQKVYLRPGYLKHDRKERQNHTGIQFFLGSNPQTIDFVFLFTEA